MSKRWWKYVEMRITCAVLGQYIPLWGEYLPPTNVVWVRFSDSTPYVGWVCCWFSTLLVEVVLRVLRFSPLLKSELLWFDLWCSQLVLQSEINWHLSKVHYVRAWLQEIQNEIPLNFPNVRNCEESYGTHQCGFCKIFGEHLVYSKRTWLFVARNQSRMSRSQQDDVTCKSPVRQFNTSFNHGESSVELKGEK